MVKRKAGIELAVLVSPPVVKQKLAKSSSLNPFQKLLRHDLVGVYIRPMQRRDFPFMYLEGFHFESAANPLSS